MTITGTLVRAGCAAARVPLDLAESRLLGERRADWPPALIFDTVESGIKQLVGSITRDDALVHEGRLERAKVAELRKAVELETIAESQREAAVAEHEARIEADEVQREQIERKKSERNRTAQSEGIARQRRAEAEAERRREAAARAEAATQAAADRQARVDCAERVQAEKVAIAKERQAVAKKKQARRIDDQLNATKATRKASRRA